MDPTVVGRRSVCTVCVGAIATFLGGCLGSESHTESEHTLELIDRDTDEVVADYHGHWHGDLPSVPVDGRVSLGGAFKGEDGTAVSLGEGRRLGAAVADGGDGTVEIESHGDHVHLSGGSSGEVSVVFQLDENETVIWETGPIDAAVK